MCPVRRERIYPFRVPGASSECMNAFPTRGGKRSGYDEAPDRRMQCVQFVGAGLPACPAVGSYRYNQAQANPPPGTRAGGDACPYKRNRAVWFLWSTANIDNIRFKLNKTDNHILLSISSGLTLRMGYIRALLPFCVQPLHLGPELQERLDNDGVKVPAAALPDDVKAGIQRQSIPVASLGGNRVKHDGQSAADQNGGKVGGNFAGMVPVPLSQVQKADVHNDHQAHQLHFDMDHSHSLSGTQIRRTCCAAVSSGTPARTRHWMPIVSRWCTASA